MASDKDTMQVVAAGVQQTIQAGRMAGLSAEGAALAACIGLLSVIRVDGLHEDHLWAQARRVTPTRYPVEGFLSCPS
jgi:hypothetical protein